MRRAIRRVWCAVQLFKLEPVACEADFHVIYSKEDFKWLLLIIP